MVSEKVAAALESTEAVGRTAAGLMRDPRPFTPGAALAGLLALAEAASRPYHKRVGANAKRLGKARRKTSA